MEATHDKQPREADCQTVYYSGTDTLSTGDVLCFDHDRGDADDYEQERLAVVEEPNSDNLDNFAGLVHPASAGETGPCSVQINRRGPADAQVDVSELGGTVEIGDLLAPQADSYKLGAAESPSDADLDVGPVRAAQEASEDGVILAEVGTFVKVTG